LHAFIRKKNVGGCLKTLYPVALPAFAESQKKGINWKRNVGDQRAEGQQTRRREAGRKRFVHLGKRGKAGEKLRWGRESTKEDFSFVGVADKPMRRKRRSRKDFLRSNV